MAATASTANLLLRNVSERMRAPYMTDRRLVAARVPAAAHENAGGAALGRDFGKLGRCIFRQLCGGALRRPSFSFLQSSRAKGGMQSGRLRKCVASHRGAARNSFHGASFRALLQTDRESGMPDYKFAAVSCNAKRHLWSPFTGTPFAIRAPPPHSFFIEREKNAPEAVPVANKAASEASRWPSTPTKALYTHVRRARRRAGPG